MREAIEIRANGRKLPERPSSTVPQLINFLATVSFFLVPQIVDGGSYCLQIRFAINYTNRRTGNRRGIHDGHQQVAFPTVKALMQSLRTRSRLPRISK